MCDFKPGDEVLKFRAGLPYNPHRASSLPDIPVGFVGVVSRILYSPSWPEGVFGLEFVGHRIPDHEGGYFAGNFRKVHRRDLTAWLSTSTDFEEPKRAPAKKRERAS